MPNRIIKESICSSDQIDQLTWIEEVLFYRLMVNVDDFGRFDGRVKMIRSKLFPLKDIREATIEEALRKLSSVELVELYTVRGQPFVRLTGWDRHQTIRNQKSKYPGPEEADSVCASLENNCKQLKSIESECSRNPIQSESESESEAESETRTREAADTAYAYASNNLYHMSPRNMEELGSFGEDMEEDVIRHAVDEACAHGNRSWAYARSVLRQYVQDGVKNMNDVREREQKREKSANKSRITANNPALNYEQRDNDYSGIFVDLSEFGGDGQ